jgi:hypothetical protein
MDEFILTIDKDKFRSTNAKWNELMLNDPWSVGYVSTLIETANWKNKEEWEETYYKSGASRNQYIEQNAADLGYSKEFFNDTTVPRDTRRYYALSWDVKNINTQRGRTKDDFREKGKLLYEAVKDNGHGLTLDECVECVRFRVICETWNGIILREHNTKATLVRLFPELTIKETPGEVDHTYAVDLEVFKSGRLICGIQVKPKSYTGNAPYIVKARKANAVKYELYREKFGVPVFTIISNSKGEILNPETLSKIKQL